MRLSCSRILLFIDLTLRANALARLGDYAAARRAYGAAVERTPDWAVAYLNLGDLQVLHDELDAGLASLRRAIALDPGLAMAHQNAAAIYQRDSYRADGRE